MSRSSRDTGHSCVSRSRDRRISTRSCPSGCPCRLASSPKSWRRPLSPWENKVCAFSTTSTTGSYSHSLASSCLHTGTWCSSTSACWAFGSTGKRANSCQRRGSLFSAWSSIRSTKQHASPRNVLSQCWTASRPYQAGRRFHWNSFRGSWGIWLQLRWQFRSVCSIWDRFSTGSMAESRGGRGNTALTGFRLHRPAARPSGRGQIPRSFGQECPWSTYPGMLWYSQMPRPQAGEPRVHRARSIRGLDGSPTALAYQLPRVASSTPCPEPSQRAPSAQGRSGPYGQHCDRCVYQPARRFALPSHVATRPPPPPLESEASEVPSCHPHPRSVQSGSRRAVSSSTSRRVETPSPGGSADLGTVRSCSGRPVCISRNHPLPRVLLPNRGNARHGCTGTQLAPGPAQICVPPSEPTSTDTVQDQGGRGAGLVSGSILAQQDLVPGTHAPRDSPSLANSSEEGSAFSETGHPMAPAPGPVETPRMVPGWDAEVLADLPQEVALTITSARAPSTRRAYTLKWNLFVEWCSSHQEDPRRCSIRAVLSFLQQGLERRLSPSTLKVYVAAISAYHDPVEGKSVGKHNLVVRFLRGARRLNPPRPPSLPSWDLALVLRALITAPFEPLQSVELKFLSMKTLLLTALASIKRVGDLQAFSVDDSCLQFGPADSSATLRPRPGYVPKVPTTPFRDQVVNLQALPPEEADPALALLCPVRALRQYTDRTQSFRTSEQLFVCYGGQQKGKAVSKQRMAHWIVDAITLAYEAQGVPCPLRLRAHSTRGVVSSWALARGTSLADICRAAGWATPNTFARFYSLRVEPVSSCVLTSNG